MPKRASRVYLLCAVSRREYRPTQQLTACQWSMLSGNTTLRVPMWDSWLNTSWKSRFNFPCASWLHISSWRRQEIWGPPGFPSIGHWMLFPVRQSGVSVKITLFFIYRLEQCFPTRVRWKILRSPARNCWTKIYKHLKYCKKFQISHEISQEFWFGNWRWPRGLKCRSAAALLLGLRVRNPSAAWMSVCCECCVLSEGSAKSLSLVQGSSTACSASNRVWSPSFKNEVA